MNTTALRRPLAPAALAAALLAAFLVLFSPMSASAHDALVSSNPEADSTVETLPAEIVLTFSADLITGDGATEVQVTDAAGTLVTDGAAVTEGATVTQPLAEGGEAGTYQVVWKVVSSDGHPTSGEFSFTTTAGAPSASPSPEVTATATPETTAAPAPSTTATTAPAADDENPASAALIWVLAIIGLLVLAAAVTAAVVLSKRRRSAAPSPDSDAPAAR